jgi:predicted exporter
VSLRGGPSAQPAGALAPRRRRAVLLLGLALVAAALVQITRTQFVADLSAFLPDKPDARQRVLIEQLASGVPARTLLLAIDGGTASARADASRALATRLREGGLFEQVHNGQTDTWADIGAWVVQQRYALSPAVDARRFSAEGLREAIADTLSLLGTPAGAAVKPLLERDPTGETMRIAESMLGGGAPRSENGVWVARRGERALLVAGTSAAGADLDAQATAIAAVRAAFAPHAQAGLTLLMSGAPVFAVESRARIEQEVRWLAVAGTLLMSALLLAAFASLRALAVALLPVATGVLAGVVAVSLAFGNVHGITLGFGTTLIGEGVDYAIYYLIQARAQGWHAWLRTGWPTVRLGLLTSVCGFAALVFSGFPGLAQLGVFSLAGLLGAALFTRWVMPALAPNGAQGRGLRPQLGAWAARGVVLAPRLRWPLLALGVAAAVLLGLHGSLWQAQLGSLSPVPQATLDLDAQLRAELSAGDARTLVVVQGADLQATLARAEAAAARLDTGVAAGTLAGYDSVTRWLPSLATQLQRRGSLPEPAALHSALVQATQGGPLRAERLAAFEHELQAARRAEPITLQSLRGSALAPLLDALLLERADGSWAALLPLQTGLPASPGAEPARPDLAQVTQLLQGLPETQIVEIGPELTRMVARYLAQAQALALAGALGVVLLVALTLRSWRRVMTVCQPLLLAVLLSMGGLVAAGVPLGILHLVGLLLVVAVGSNYALFFDLLNQRALGADGAASEADTDLLASLLLANLTTVLSFGLIALSAIPSLSAIGRVVAPGALLALVLAAAFAPGLPGLHRATPKP